MFWITFFLIDWLIISIIAQIVIVVVATFFCFGIVYVRFIFYARHDWNPASLAWRIQRNDDTISPRWKQYKTKTDKYKFSKICYPHKTWGNFTSTGFSQFSKSKVEKKLLVPNWLLEQRRRTMSISYRMRVVFSNGARPNEHNRTINGLLLVVGMSSTKKSTCDQNRRWQLQFVSKFAVWNLWRLLNKK